MANRYMTRCLAPLITRAMPFKTTVRYHFTPDTMTISPNWKITSTDREVVRKGPPESVNRNVNI